jgi:hypothetical protein
MSLDQKTTKEVFLNKKFDLSYSQLGICGIKIYIHIPNKQQSRLGSKSKLEF